MILLPAIFKIIPCIDWGIAFFGILIKIADHLRPKKGLNRAVVGGALFGTAGAIVGAATAKQETKEVGGVPILYVDLSINGMNTTVSISNPPLKAADYLENAMNE